MAKTITASVGRMGGVNRTDDVRTVQNLLNNVPASSGGPTPRLDPDGKCGSLTIGAIQKFQLANFGWKGADGRVDPNGPTHIMLNAFDTPIPLPVPPPPPPPTLATSTRFVVHRMGSASSFGPNDEDWFFQFVDMTNGLIGVYWLHPSGRSTTTKQPPAKFTGASRSFNTKAPHAVDNLGCDAIYSSRDKSGKATSTMVLFLSSGAVQIADMPHHLIGPNGIIKPSGGGGEVSTALARICKFVKLG
jgi:hypothetical protein